MVDAYLENPALLAGQPKRSIADYVESQGILVPRRFATLREARASRLPIMARSEHPQDYDGASDLVPIRKDLLMIHPEILDEKDLRKKIMEEQFKIPFFLKGYPEIMGINSEEFLDKFSLSYWRLLDGFNRTITADSAIPNRYHITTTCYSEPIGELWQYMIFEDGCIKTFFQGSNGKGVPLDLIKDLNNFVDLYERIRHLDRFDHNHCPTMEFQSIFDRGRINNYFLQYHRIRDFEQTPFKLERRREIEETEFDYVRGATLPEGKVCKVATAYASEHSWNNSRREVPWKIDLSEEGSIDPPRYLVMSEIMSRRRYFQTLNGNSEIGVLLGMAYGHESRSLWFKPNVSVIQDEDAREQLFPLKELVASWDKAKETGENQYIHLHVVADGRKAFVKRV